LPKARPSPPEFFVDRSLGRYVVAEVVRALGFTVHVMAEVYPDDEDERVPDTQWIADADAQGWVVLTKDERITRRPEEQEALRVSRLRVFAIGNQHLTGPVMAEYYRVNIHRIVQRARKPGPFVDIVHAKGIERRWPQDERTGKTRRRR
jgi:hypothetical protein